MADETTTAQAEGGRTPQRIQLSRARGWRKPEGTIVVARPGRWANPFRVGSLVVDVDTRRTRTLTAEDAVAGYRAALLAGRLPMYGGAPITVDDVRRELAGHDLACWCPPGQPCHADVLLELANGPAS